MSDLVKEALSPQTLAAMGNSVKGFGSGAGMGLLAGGLGGAAIGAARRYGQERQEGSSVGSAALHSLGGAASGARTGALLGAGAGGLAGAAKPGLALAMGKGEGLLGGFSRFGQRQVHALTGVGDAKYVRSIGGGAADAQRHLGEAAGAFRSAVGPEARQKALHELQQAHKGMNAAEKAEKMGLTSLPGYAKALYKNPKEALKAGLSEQWHQGGAGTKALMFGLPAAMAANELRKGEDPTGEGHGRFERAGHSLGEGLGFAMGPLPVAGQTVMSPAVGGVMGGAGKLVDRTIGKLRHRPMGAGPTGAPEAGGGSGAEGYILSDRAAGTVPEGLNG